MNALRFLLNDLNITQRDLCELSGLDRSRVSRLASFPAGELGHRLTYFEAMAIHNALEGLGRVDADPPDFLALL